MIEKIFELKVDLFLHQIDDYRLKLLDQEVLSLAQEPWRSDRHLNVVGVEANFALIQPQVRNLMAVDELGVHHKFKSLPQCSLFKVSRKFSILRYEFFEHTLALNRLLGEASDDGA